MEGGVEVGKALEWTQGKGPEEIVEFALSLEVQSYDVYLKMEQRMKDTNDLGLCENIPLKSYPLPSLSDWVDPNIGDEPVLEGPPAVIGGVLQ